MLLRFLTIASIVASLVACGGHEGWSRVSPIDLAGELGSPNHELVIVDVREPELYRAGHIPGAINLPYPDSKTNFSSVLKPDQNIVFVCHGGPMGDQMAAILAEKGYRHLRNLEGGMNTWTGDLESAP